MTMRPIDAVDNRRRRIAIVLPTLTQYGGVEQIRIVLAREFLACGYECDLITAQNTADRITDVPAELREINFGVQRLRNFFWPFLRYLKKERPDAVLVAMWPLTSISLIAHRLSGSRSRIVVSEHTTLSNAYPHFGGLHRLFLRLSLASTYRLANACVAVSEGAADDVATLGWLPRADYRVIHNPLRFSDSHIAAASNPAVEAAWGGWTGKRIITAGTLKREKNHPLLLRSFKLLLESMDARLLILGAGELENDIRRAIQDEGLEGKVILAGFASDPVPWYQSADLFVLSSDCEGFGNVILEALGCGVPVVSTDCPSGPAEILENGRYGELVPVGDAEALAAAMARSLNAEHDHEALKRRAGEFRPDAIAEEYLDLLLPQRK